MAGLNPSRPSGNARNFKPLQPTRARAPLRSDVRSGNPGMSMQLSASIDSSLYSIQNVSLLVLVVDSFPPHLRNFHFLNTDWAPCLSLYALKHFFWQGDMYKVSRSFDSPTYENSSSSPSAALLASFYSRGSFLVIED